MYDELATPREASQEYARNVGIEHTERAWILSPFDVWEPNPAYRGEPVPHPESEEAQLDEELPF